MANYQSLKAAINAVIKANGNKEITGTVLNEVLLAMVNSLGAGYQFAGVATPSTNPGTPDQKVFYIASQAGTYTNFNAVVLPAGIHLLLWNGAWSTQTFLTIDDEPTAGSDNLVKSGGVFGLNEHILDNVENFGVEYSSTDVHYRIKPDGSRVGADVANVYRINNVPSYYKKIVVLSDCANDSLCVAFYSSNSLGTSTFISGVAGQNQPILSEHKLGYYEVDIPQGTVMITITCVNLNGQAPKAVFGANGSYPKELAVAKSDIKNIEGNGEENIISQKTTTEYLNDIREVADIVKYSSISSVYKEGWLTGNVGDTISITAQSGKKYAIIPFEKTGILQYHKYYSSLNTATYFLDSNDIILAKSPLLDSTENDAEYMDCIPEGTKKVAFTCSEISSSYLINYLITCDRILYPAVFEQGCVLANGTVNKASTVQKYAKINVKGSKYLMADVKNYGAGGECYLINFYSENGTFISHKYPNISSDSSHTVFVAAEIPENAAYAYVMTRADYVNNAKVYVDNYSTFIDNHTIALEDELNSYKENGELSNKKVYDYYNTTFIAGAPVGNVGETISYDTSSASSYHVEFDCKGFTCIEWSSKAGGAICFVDENDVILKKLQQRAGTRIDVFDGAAKFIVYVHRDYRSVFNATLYNFDILPIKSCVGFNGVVSDGEFILSIEVTGEVSYNRQYNSYISYKIPTSDLKAVFAKVRNYGGSGVQIFSFWSENDEFISYSIAMDGSDTFEFVGALVPSNAKYCIICSRQYDVKLFASAPIDAETIALEKGYITLSPTYNYSGNAIKLQRNNFKVGRIGQTVVPQYITIDNVNLGGQGMAIFGDVMFKFYNKGYYNVYRIREGLQLEYINQFHLGSYGDDQHVNNCQFSTIMSDTGFPYLYVGSAASPLITVEKVSLSANGVLVQTIDISGISGGYNVGIDENYLWLFGGSQTTLKVLKFNIPSLTESEVTLTENDALDSFEYPHNYNADGQIQGGKVYNDKLYWVFGANRSYHPGVWKRALYVFDLKNKVRESFVDLSDVLEHELEDFEIYGNIGLISINQMANTEESYNGNGLYFIKFD